MERIETKCCVNLIENEKCDVFELEKTVMYGQDLFHRTEEKLNASCEDIDLQSVGVSKSNAINISKKLLNTLNEIHPIINISDPSANEMEVICKEEESYQDEFIPFTFVAVSPVSGKIAEFDAQRSCCVSDSELKDPLEGYPHNRGKRKVVHVKEERENFSGSEIKIEIKKENDDSELSSKVSDTLSLANALEMKSHSEINSIAQETKHLCDGLPTSLQGIVLMTSEDIGGAQSKQSATCEQTVHSFCSEDCYSDGGNGLDIEFESIIDEKYDSLTLNGVSGTFKCEAEELSLVEKRGGKEGFCDPITKRLKLKDCTVVLERIVIPYQKEDGKHSAFRRNLCYSNTEEEKESNKIYEEPETLRFEQCRTVINTNKIYERRNNPSVGKRFSCNIRHPIFDECENFELHTSFHSSKNPFSCRICGKFFQEEKRLKKHIRTHSAEKSFSCRVCKKCFACPRSLQTHMRTLALEKAISCEVCDASFLQKCGLKEHMKTHTGYKPFSCDVCGRSFSFRSNLKEHFKIHTGEKPFSCKVCRLSFSNKGHFNHHFRTHTGEKPYSCKVCKASFARSNTLNQHFRTHSGEKPFSCDICKSSFSQKVCLIHHLRTHTGEKPFSCDVCDSSFSRQDLLHRHMRTHTGEKPYSCDICKASFSQKGSLKAHMLTHSGEKPYICDVCNSSFTRKVHLHRHNQNIHC